MASGTPTAPRPSRRDELLARAHAAVDRQYGRFAAEAFAEGVEQLTARAHMERHRRALQEAADATRTTPKVTPPAPEDQQAAQRLLSAMRARARARAGGRRG